MKYGVGTNQAYRKLRMKAARKDNYWLLTHRREGHTERCDLYHKLQGEVDVDWAQRERLENWLKAIRLQRRKAWTDWPKTQCARSGGKNHTLGAENGNERGVHKAIARKKEVNNK